MSESHRIEHRPWPLRAPLLLLIGGTVALAVHLLTRAPEMSDWPESPLMLGAATALAAGATVFALSLERSRWPWSLSFAVAAGLLVGFVTWGNGVPSDRGAGEGWRLVSALVAVAVALPLFQASRDAGRWHPEYRAVHDHAWTDILVWCAALGFMVLTWLLFNLLGELFHLIGIDALIDRLREPWFATTMLGGALGAAIGLLRDRDQILGLLRRVAIAILSVLAPILAAGLALFVAALPFTGLEPLWQQTKATTPILLGCIAGAVILVNAAIGSAAEEESPSRIVRWAAAALAAVALPLALVAAVSTGKRIAQHGFTPDRLWAAVFVAMTVIGAAVYLLALLRGRAGWPALLRTLNLRLAIGIAVLALFLALPIVNFGAISTRDQVARLESGRIAPDKFDWAALRFDFGPAGRKALARLQSHRNPNVAGFAALAAKAESRWDVLGETRRDVVRGQALASEVRILPAGSTVPLELATEIAQGMGTCKERADCAIYMLPGGREALLFDNFCFRDGDATPPPRERCGAQLYSLRNGAWSAAGSPLDGAQRRRLAAGYESGAIEIRKVEARQAYIGGERVGAPF